ncbi:hypothetical protein ACFUEL_39765, partial [Kitasatospora sp. NPDC057198]
MAPARICQVCGERPAAGGRYSAVVRGRDPGGGRLLVACGAEHLAVLLARWRRHPCTPEELWLGQIYAALRLVGREP